MATISSAGIGSGLDVNSIVTQLMTIEKQPLTQMQAAADKIQGTLSSYGKIQSYLSDLQSAAQELTSPSNWSQTTASSADASIVAASTDSTAAAGAYSVSVQQLATAQALASGKFASSATAVGSGTLHIELGRWGTDPSGFVSRVPAGTVDVVIDPSATSLSAIRDKINAAHGGVTAAIINDSSGARLVLRSSATGEANGFKVSVTDDDGNDSDAAGLSALAYDPDAGISNMSRSQSAADAKATVNGLAVTSTSNSFDNIVDGLSFKVGKVSSSPVEVNVATNTEAIKTLITKFADAYNSVAKYLSDETAYDASTKKAGSLQGDSGANSLRSQLRAIVGDTLAASKAGAFSRLADIGLDPQANGTLKVNTGKLASAMDKLADVKTLFMSATKADGNTNGFATRLRGWTSGLLGLDGALTTREDSLRRQLDANSKKQDSFNNRMTVVEARLRAQYTALDNNVSKSSSLQTYMTQQINLLNKTASSS